MCDEARQAIMELESQRECKNSFDISVIDKLAKFYSPSEIRDMMTDSNKDVFVYAIELKIDYSKDVSKEMYDVYKAIIAEQSQTDCQGMQM